MDKQMFWRGKLIRESEWNRVYESDRWGEVHESKFLIDGIQVSAESIISRWKGFSLAEKLEFANAFAVKREVTSEDERTLDFLMEASEPVIWATIAPMLRRHTDRERVLGFLLDTLKDEGLSKANFYQGLELLNDKRALPALREDYQRYECRLVEHGKLDPEDSYLEYLSCCKALLVIDGSKEYEDAIKQQAQSEDERVRVWAEKMLRDQ